MANRTVSSNQFHVFHLNTSSLHFYYSLLAIICQHFFKKFFKIFCSRLSSLFELGNLLCVHQCCGIQFNLNFSTVYWDVALYPKRHIVFFPSLTEELSDDFFKDFAFVVLFSVQHVSRTEENSVLFQQLLFQIFLNSQAEVFTLISACLFYWQEPRHDFRNLYHVEHFVIYEAENVGISGWMVSIIFNHCSLGCHFLYLSLYDFIIAYLPGMSIPFWYFFNFL